MSHVLQHLVMPNLVFGAPEEMYARLDNDKVHALMSEGRLLFDAGGRASFDTFFNSVTVGAWKTHTAVQDLQLHLRGTGRFIVRLGMHRIGHAHRWLAEHVVTLSPEQDVQIDVDSWTKLESGMLYFALEALEAGSVTAGHFATCTAPQREVKLGIVITHFNRKQWVLPAIERIRNELLSDPLYKDRIELVVVDNSQNITAEEAQGITLIPNKNLGGSGGFTRGLLHLKDQKDFTHCLFMDDDASCEIDSIRRAVAFAEFAVAPELAMSGALLRELEPFRLWEKGVIFDGVCRPMKSGCDVRNVGDLLWVEQLEKEPDFGAWWFFMFNIREVSRYPYPFFVRGDDLLFGLMNDFKIITLNGVACWGDDFVLKAGPLPNYLDVRNHIVQYVRLDKSLGYVLKKLFGFFFGSLLSYNYASARAICKAVSDSLLGPNLYKSNMDMSSIRGEINSYASAEKMSPIDRRAFDLVHRDLHESRGRKILRWLTLNGFLIPGFLLKDVVVYQPKGFRASWRSIFRAKRVFYEYEPLSLGYIAEHDKSKFFIEFFRFLAVITKFVISYARLKKDYCDELNLMTSENFWRNIYSK
jgi:galactofuranosylgalactofuranosylrhamnosyl-N-acetylglucosaminyl-diphospho-decaprenol beta-1,5/1,6-galactofuranosyltransferase